MSALESMIFDPTLARKYIIFCSEAKMQSLPATTLASTGHTQIRAALNARKEYEKRTECPEEPMTGFIKPGGLAALKFAEGALNDSADPKLRTLTPLECHCYDELFPALLLQIVPVV
jgi:hypothetical protein